MSYKLTLIIFFLTLSGTVHSLNAGKRSVLSIGCHSHDGTCYVQVDGDPIGPEASCTQTSFRWSSATDPNHDKIFALLTTAFAASKQVTFTLENSCFSVQSNYPTISYINVHN